MMDDGSDILSMLTYVKSVFSHRDVGIPLYQFLRIKDLLDLLMHGLVNDFLLE